MMEKTLFIIFGLLLLLVFPLIIRQQLNYERDNDCRKTNEERIITEYIVLPKMILPQPKTETKWHCIKNNVDFWR